MIRIEAFDLSHETIIEGTQAETQIALSVRFDIPHQGMQFHKDLNTLLSRYIGGYAYDCEDVHSSNPVNVIFNREILKDIK